MANYSGHGHTWKGGRTKTYACWNDMINRCTNPRCTAYNCYGGRGISIDPRWSLFDNFLADMGEKPDGLTLDRIDVDGNYTKENCRWATRKEQSNNRRDNKLLEFNGGVLTITQWANKLGVLPPALYWRLNNGWSLEKTLTTGSTRHG